MTIARKSVMTASWRLIGLLVGMALFIVSIQTQEAYAETKKVSGTCEVITRLTRSAIPCFSPTAGVPFRVHHSMLNSDDPNWNNVQRFTFQYDDISKDRHFRGYGVNTHPNGDQTFFQYEGTKEPLPSDPYSHTWKTEGFFMKGTGKFKGIKGRIVGKGKWTMTEDTCEWEVEYEIR